MNRCILANTRKARRTTAFAVTAILAVARPLVAHSGPPYPIASSITAGPYVVSVWTDPDTTDDGTAAGQFWIVLEPGASPGGLPAGTRATVSVKPLDRRGMERGAVTAPVRGDLANQFAALVLDHEGPFAVTVVVTGPLGSATIATQADATYNLRPPPVMIAVYLLPFLAAGFLWAKLLLRRRQLRAARGVRSRSM